MWHPCECWYSSQKLLRTQRNSKGFRVGGKWWVRSLNPRKMAEGIYETWKAPTHPCFLKWLKKSKTLTIPHLNPWVFPVANFEALKSFIKFWPPKKIQKNMIFSQLGLDLPCWFRTCDHPTHLRGLSLMPTMCQQRHWEPGGGGFLVDRFQPSFGWNIPRRKLRFVLRLQKKPDKSWAKPGVVQPFKRFWGSKCTT